MEVDSGWVDWEGDAPNVNFCSLLNPTRTVEQWWMWTLSMFISFRALRKITLVEDPLSISILLIRQLAMSNEMTRASW